MLVGGGVVVLAVVLAVVVSENNFRAGTVNLEKMF
jgi:hypothetical protein